MGTRVFFLIVGAAFASAAFASDEPERAQIDPREIPSATVTITAEADAVATAKTPNPVVILDAEKLSRIGSAGLARALDLAKPGFILNNGALGSITTFNINGSRSRDTVVLLDGIRISQDPSSLDLSAFSLTGIDRVEILSGPASTLYGADAHGGVVSLYSAGPAAKGLSGNLLGQTSTLGQMRSGISAAYGWDDGWLQASGDFEQSPQPTKTENPYRHSSGHIGFGQQLGENSLLSLNHRRQYSAAPLPYQWGWDWPPSREYGYGREYARWQDITTASLKSAFTGSLYGELNLGKINQEGYDTNDGYSSNLSRYQGNALLRWKHGKGSLAALMDYKSEEYWNSNEADNTATARNTAIALEGSLEAMPVLRFVASARQQWDKIESDQYGWNDASNTSLSQTTWKAGANLLLPSGFRAYINTGTAFNAPSLYELGYNQSRGQAAPENERSHSILAGAGYGQAGWWIKADAARIDYSQIVEFFGIWGDANSYYANSNNIRVQSLELSGGARGSGWEAEIYVRSQEGRAMDAPKEEQLRWFQNRPFFSAGARGNWTWNRIDAGLNISYIGHRYVYSNDAGAAGQAEKTHYIDAMLFATYRHSEALSFTLRAERLFQDGISREGWEAGRDLGRNNVSLLPGYPSLGRSISLEGRYRF